MLKIEPLYYLYLVNNFKSIKLAADAIHVTPSAISKALHKWQDEIGTPLIQQTYRSVELTPLAKEIVKRSETIIKELYLIEELIEDQQNTAAVKENHPLTLYTANSFYQTDLAGIWRYFDSFGLDIDVADSSADNNSYLQAVNDDVNSFLLNFFAESPENPLPKLPNVEYIKILDTKPYLLCAQDFPIVHKSDAYIEPAELGNTNIIIYDKGYEVTIPVCKEIEKRQKLNITYTSSIIAMQAMLAKKTGCTISTTTKLKFLQTVTSIPSAKNLKRLPIKADVNIALYLCFHKDLNEKNKNILRKVALDIAE